MLWETAFAEVIPRNGFAAVVVGVAVCDFTLRTLMSPTKGFKWTTILLRKESQ